MTTTNAIKAIEKAGYKVELVEGSTRTYRAIIGANLNRVLEFFADGDGGSINCIGVRNIKDQNDPYTDYCAFSFYRNLTQALKYNA